MVDKKALSNMNSKQKITAVVIAVVVLIILWQVYGLFGGGGGGGTAGPTPPPPPPPANGAASAPKAPETKPQASAELPKPKPDKMTPLEAELMRMQQETQMKYLTALNQLQMLKIERDIADSNKALMASRLDTIKTQKDIIKQLVPNASAQPDFAQLGAPGGAAPAQAMPGGRPSSMPVISDVKYTVISVALLENKWSAVLAYQNSLFNVYVGDILPPDGSKIISISNSGVVLEKDGVKMKISLVPII